MTAESWEGRIIAEKYCVEQVLGRGGMGVVVRARHVRLDEPVAIKILLPAMMEVHGMVTRFLREARAASKIKSPHVVRVTDVDMLENGVPYMVMEHLDGTDLAALRRRSGPIEAGEAVRYVLEACDAIAEAHSVGIVHRDLKPANLFLARGRDGKESIKVLDFGISKVDAPDQQDTTKTGQMMGSPKYMSPEQMLSMHDVDARSDIWSLGAILYDLLAGRPPFMAESTPGVCALVLEGRPPPLREHRPGLPAALEAIVLRCLARDRDQRFATVPELAAALAPFGPPGLGARIALGPLPSLSSVTATAARAPEEVPTVMYGPGERPARTAIAEAAHSPTISTWNAGTPAVAPRRGARVIAAGLAGAALLLGGWLWSSRAPHASSAQPAVAIEPTAPPRSADAEGGAPAGVLAAAPQIAPAGVLAAAPQVAGADAGAEPATSAAAPEKRPAAKPKAPVPGAPGGADPFGGKRR